MQYQISLDNAEREGLYGKFKGYVRFAASRPSFAKSPELAS